MYVEPVIGYRAWHISTGTYDLVSPIVQREHWPADDAIHARCCPISESRRQLTEPHGSPATGCRCGLYAWHELDDALHHHSSNGLSVVGPVLGWGKFVVAPRGFRIEYMRPLALTEHCIDCPRPLGWTALLKLCIKKYRIPLLPGDLVQDYAETWGKPMGIEFTE